MTRITNADQVLLLLRLQIERMQRAPRKRAERQGKAGPLQRVRQLAGAEGVSETDVARALIAALLTEEFGADFAAAPRFQRMVEDVREIIDRDDAARALLRRAIAQLTPQGG